MARKHTFLIRNVLLFFFLWRRIMVCLFFGQKKINRFFTISLYSLTCLPNIKNGNNIINYLCIIYSLNLLIYYFCFPSFCLDEMFDLIDDLDTEKWDDKGSPPSDLEQLGNFFFHFMLKRGGKFLHNLKH